MSAINDAWVVLKNYRGPSDSPAMVSMTSQKMAGYIAEIQQLKEENAMLRAQLESLQQQWTFGIPKNLLTLEPQ